MQLNPKHEAFTLPTMITRSTHSDAKPSENKMPKAKVKVDMESGIIELNNYWPHGIKNSGKETNPNLIYLFSKKIVNSNGKCSCSKLEANNHVEIKRELTCRRLQLEQKFSEDTSEVECFKEFRKNLTVKDSISLSRYFICSICMSPYSDAFIDIYIDLPAVKIYVQKEKLHLYYDLEAASYNRKFIIWNLLYGFRSLLKEGKLVPANFNFKEDVKLTEKRRHRSAPFGLKRADFQIIDWMKKFESKKKIERNAIIKRSLCPIKDDFKIKLGNSGFYLNNGGLKTTAGATPPKHIRIKTGLLMNLLSTKERHQTIIGSIRSNEMSLEKKQSRIEHYNKKCPKNLTSDATIIVCLRSKLKNWISSCRKDFEGCKIAKLADKNDKRTISYNDLICADVILTTYEYLTEFPKTNIGSGRKLMKTKGKFHLSNLIFRRLIYDDLSKNSSYFFKTYHDRGLKLESDFVFGIVSSKFELSKKFFNAASREYLRLPKFIKYSVGLNQFINEKFIKTHKSSKVPPAYAEETVLIDLNSNEKKFLSKDLTANNLDNIFNFCQSPLTGQLSLQTVSYNYRREKLIPLKKIEAEIEAERELNHMNNLDPLSEDDFKAKFSFSFDSLNQAKSSYNFVKTKLDDLSNRSTRECCPICHEQIPEEELSISKCCHVFCFGCAEDYFNERNMCPVCFQSGSSLMRIIIDPIRDELKRKHRLVLNKFGSRLLKLACYLKDLIATEPDSRIVLYVKNQERKKCVKELLDAIKLPASGFGSLRKKNIGSEGGAKIVILTRSKRNLMRNLRSISHFIILQPFRNVKHAVAAENDGIKCVNYFGRKTPLKVVRFALRDTIEEKLLIKTQNY